ncbi:hypothetical protein XF30_25690 [Bradyrhizobium sp. SUTN9-2]|uniref:hypothetical protein n=1 Tax=Bradyrhizobium sp. SUTN9-2 TaxID=1167456 RepID=UPI000D64975B|nr:hypothetical protein [Bradyrhizobium sp. SUTN9-2]PWE79653.1 hypothetical protein XF30_25690 [Bradyrhizobium sp. SUTN9-2]
MEASGLHAKNDSPHIGLCGRSGRLRWATSRKSLATHPIRRVFDAGVVVIINTDDVLVFGQGVSEEFLNLYTVGLSDAEELEAIRVAGLFDLDRPECHSKM